MTPPSAETQSHLDRVLRLFDYLRVEGWLLAPGESMRELKVYFGDECVHVERMSLNLPSPDIQLHPSCRFVVSCLVKDASAARVACLVFSLTSGRTVRVPLPESPPPPEVPEATLLPRFRELLAANRAATLVELGGRARSGIIRREIYGVPQVTSVDVVSGPGVDVVADAHELSRALGPRRFDALASIFVFEHLAMPWKVALEMNRVLEPGGLAYVVSHQTCGMHDLPWDFWRFSDSAYRALFNSKTGFEVVDVRLSYPMHIFPFVHHAPTWNDVEKTAGFRSAEVIVRKTGETLLNWPVRLSDILSTPYPE